MAGIDPSLQIQKGPSDQRGRATRFVHRHCRLLTLLELPRSPNASGVNHLSLPQVLVPDIHPVDPDAAQENIAYARALNSEHQLELLNTLSSNFATNDYRLLIVDSIMACFRVDFCGRGELADRQQKLNQFLSKLTHMAEEFNVCVLMVRDAIPFSLFCVLVTNGKSGWCADRSHRRTKCNRTPAPALSSLVPMAVNPLVDISWRMRRLPGFCCARGGAMRGWLRYKIPLVRSRSPDPVRSFFQRLIPYRRLSRARSNVHHHERRDR